MLPVFDRSESARYLLALVAAVYLALAAASALTRAPHNEEAYFASPAVNLATKGYMGTGLLEPSSRALPGVERRTYWVMPLYMLNEAVWFKIFGFSLLAQRALSIAWGLVAIGAWYIILLRLGGSPSLAVLAAALAGLDFLFIDVASLGRMDMMTAALGFAALAAYLSLREHRLELAVLSSHALIAAAFMTNPNALLHLAALGALTLYFDRRRMRLQHVAVAALPYAFAGAAWGLYILQDPASFRAQIAANSGHRLDLLAAPWQTLAAEVTERYGRGFGLRGHSAGHSGPIYVKALLLAGYVFGIAAMLLHPPLRRHSRLRVLLILAAVYFGVQCFFNHKLTIYLVHTLPSYAACLAVAAWWFWSRRSLPRAVVAFALAGFFALQTGGHVLRASQDPWGRAHRPAIEFLKRCAPEEAVIYGTAAMAFDLGFEERLRDDRYLGLRTGKLADFVVVEDIYRDAWSGLRKRDPHEVERVEALLKANYTALHHYGSYDIYVRNGSSCRAAP